MYRIFHICILLIAITGIRASAQEQVIPGEQSVMVPFEVMSRYARSGTAEHCFNGIDDDGDGLIDCADGDCQVLANGGFENVPTAQTPNAFVTFPQYPTFMGSWAAVNIDGEVFYQSGSRPAFEGNRYASLLQNSGANPRTPWNEISWGAGGYDRFLFIANTQPGATYNMVFHHAGDDRYGYFGDQTLVQVQSMDTDYYYDTLVATPGYFDWTAVQLTFNADDETNSVAILFSALGNGTASVLVDDLKLCGEVIHHIIAVDDEATAIMDMPVSIEVLANDLNLPDAGLTVNTLGSSLPQHGSVEIEPDGSITYTPDPGFSGADSFQYEICNTRTYAQQCDQATVRIIVQSAPQVSVDTFVIAMEEDASLELCDEYFEISDPDMVSICQDGAYGNCVINEFSCTEFYPDADYYGNDTICVVQCSNAVCDTGVFIIEVLPVNDAPLAKNDKAATIEGTTVSINVTANDSDPRDGGPVDPASLVILRSPDHGFAHTTSEGTIVYSPEPGFSGKEQLQYMVFDLGTPMPALSDTAWVEILVEAGHEEIRCMIPEAFSPNGDGLYDQFRIECAAYYPEMELHIYDRYGNQMYRSGSGYNNDWDGTSMNNNKPLREGTYFWVVNFNDEHTKDRAGHVLIWR
jgi:gliding motility-associated-like protein